MYTTYAVCYNLTDISEWAKTIWKRIQTYVEIIRLFEQEISNMYQSLVHYNFSKKLQHSNSKKTFLTLVADFLNEFLGERSNKFF